MKMNSNRIICYASTLIFLMAASGCAKNNLIAKDSDVSESSNFGIIQGIKSKDENSVIVISVSKPLTYTSYKTSEPPKIFIDLAQTEPGQLTPLTFESGPIESINTTRQSFGSGFLSRIEISLKKDTDFQVKQDPQDRGTLTVTLLGPASNGKTTGVKAIEDQVDDSKPITIAENPIESAPSLIVDDVKATPQHEGEPSVADAIDKVQSSVALPTPTPASGIDSGAMQELKGISVVDGKIVISVNGGEIKFTSFKLDKPGRLVVDLFEVKNSVKGQNFVAIDRFGITKARIGSSPGKVRIVFDSAKDQVSKYVIEKCESGLTVSLAEPAATLTSNLDASLGTSTNVVDNKTDSVTRGAIEAIDFKIIDGLSRIEVGTNGGCNIQHSVETKKGIMISLNNCELPSKLQRTIETKAFISPVQNITPYKVKLAGIPTSRILISLRNKASYSERKNGNTLILDVKNPVLRSSSSSLSQNSPAPVNLEDEIVASQKDIDPSDLPKSIVTKQQSKKVYSGRKVTLEFSDADIRKIFQLIAEVSHLNFLIADDVTGTISIKLVNVPWDQALDVILDAKNLGMIREGNIAQIKPKSKMQSLADEEMAAKKASERAMALRTEIFDVNYASVADIATQFSALKSERGIISTDARTNRVIVKDIATAIDDMRLLLKSLDTPEKQVMIEARIVEATTSFVRDLGVQWGIHYTDGSASVAGISRLDTGFGGQVSPAPTSGTAGPGAAVGMSFGKLSSNLQLDMRLSAAVTASQIKLISSPRVVTLNNKPAKISSGQAIPYQTTSAEGTKTEFVEAALTLEVTPHVTADGSIGMKIKAANNSPGVGSPPPISKKEATTELLLKNGETTVIGGIYTDNDTSEDKGVPFLQDIPLLGWLFKSNSARKEKNELLIFITPKIVS